MTCTEIQTVQEVGFPYHCRDVPLTGPFKAQTFGIALPSWIVSKEYSFFVLLAYGLVFMVVLPTAVVSNAEWISHFFAESYVFTGYMVVPVHQV